MRLNAVLGRIFGPESCCGRIARAKNGPKRVLCGASKSNPLISLHIRFCRILHNDYYWIVSANTARGLTHASLIPASLPSSRARISAQSQVLTGSPCASHTPHKSGSPLPLFPPALSAKERHHAVPRREVDRDGTPAPCAGLRPIFVRKAMCRGARMYHRQVVRSGRRQRSVVRLARSESKPPKHPATCAPSNDTQSRSAQVL